MSNLLPEKQKKEFLRNYILRIIFFGGILFGMILIISVTILESFLFLVKSEMAILESNLSDLQKTEITTFEQNILLANRTNKKLEVLTLDTNSMSSTEVIDLVLAEKNEDILINNFSIDLGEQVITLKISGIANTREAFISFLDELEKHPLIQSVESPLSSLSSSINISYTIDIVINPKGNEAE
tara:strand:+ start:4161 stop:4712 length:552 start_codon:yes stop_codon:yes gene_type:complete